MAARRARLGPLRLDHGRQRQRAASPQAHVRFSELAEPDSADLLDKVAAVKVWRRTAAGQPQTLKLTKHVHGRGRRVGRAGRGRRRAALGARSSTACSTRREQTFLLGITPSISMPRAADFKALARDEKLPFDIVPHAADKGFDLEVLFQGKPVERAARWSSSIPTAKRIDDQDRCQRPLALAGKARPVFDPRQVDRREPARKATRNIRRSNHYSTLALRVPQEPDVPGAGRAAQPASAAPSCSTGPAKPARSGPISPALRPT